MTSLIVALDMEPGLEARDVANSLAYQAGVECFKIGVPALLHEEGRRTAEFIRWAGLRLMLDLKLYDTRDTVLRTMKAVERLGAHMVTVHEDCVAHAREVRGAAAVIAVRALTDGTGGKAPREFSNAMIAADGLICSVGFAAAVRRFTDKLLVCPGIRPAGTAAHNHQIPATPRQARDAGADYVVVGRPIYQAADPVAAARAIIREIEPAIGSPGREG